MTTKERLELEKTLVTCDGSGKKAKEENLDALLRDAYNRGLGKRPSRDEMARDAATRVLRAPGSSKAARVARGSALSQR